MHVNVSVRDHRVDLILSRPEVLNAMDFSVFDSLAAAVDEIAAMDGARVVVVRGEGRSLSSGIDTSTFGELTGTPDERIERAQAPFRKLTALAIPTIAMVQGHALGAGLQLALACDLRVVAEDASLGLLEGKYGIIPDLGGTQRLPLLVGPGWAKRMIWLAERIDGTTAGRIRLAEIVVTAAELETAVDDLAQRIASAPPLATKEAKRLVEMAGTVPHAAGMDEEARAQLGLLTSADFGEAIAAFVEGRTPRYKGV